MLNYVKLSYTGIMFAMRPKHLSCTYTHTRMHTRTHSLSWYQAIPHLTGIKTHVLISVRNVRNIQIHTNSYKTASHPYAHCY